MYLKLSPRNLVVGIKHSFSEKKSWFSIAILHLLCSIIYKIIWFDFKSYEFSCADQIVFYTKLIWERQLFPKWQHNPSLNRKYFPTTYWIFSPLTNLSRSSHPNVKSHVPLNNQLQNKFSTLNFEGITFRLSWTLKHTLYRNRQSQQWRFNQQILWCLHS